MSVRRGVILVFDEQGSITSMLGIELEPAGFRTVTGELALTNPQRGTLDGALDAVLDSLERTAQDTLYASLLVEGRGAKA